MFRIDRSYNINTIYNKDIFCPQYYVLPYRSSKRIQTDTILEFLTCGQLTH